MEIYFSTKKLLKQMSQHREMVKAYGPIQAKKLQIVLTAIRAAPNLETLGPAYNPPHRCHELKGNLKGVLSLDLNGQYRLLAIPDHDPLPILDDGTLDWTQITAIIIKEVKDTHGK